MRDKVLTEKRLQILNYIQSFVQDKGFPPSVREIAKFVNLSSASSVHSHLNTLVDGGYLVRDPSKPRALKVNFKGNAKGSQIVDIEDRTNFKSSQITTDVFSVPILGSVAAGTGVIAEQNIEDYIGLPSVLLGSGDFFGLRVRGESMINAGILDKDLVVCRSQSTAEIGQIVVAGINGDEATVKYFHRYNDRIHLKPANENFSIIDVMQDEVTIFGKAVTIIRSLN